MATFSAGSGCYNGSGFAFDGTETPPHPGVARHAAHPAARCDDWTIVSLTIAP